MKATARRLAMIAVAAAAGAAAPAGPSMAQQPAAKAAGAVHDVYEPSQRQRLRRESCARDEEALGPHCVKKCEQGFSLSLADNKPACRSLKPLPPGRKPGPMQRHAVERPRALEPAPAPGKGPPEDK